MQRQTVLRILLANLLAQAGIIFTGAVVRVSGSGLGCPTWPQCVPGSFVPTAHQEQGWHKFVEYGNRTLTGVLIVVAVLAAITVYRSSKDRSLRRLALVPLAGTFAQAILGGITVLTKLHSATVIAHFLLSVLLVWFSAKLWFRARFETAEPHTANNQRLALYTLVSAVVMLTLGSITTGTGPNSGDQAVGSAFPLDPRLPSMLHSAAVWVFIGCLVLGWTRADLNPFARRMLHGITGIAALEALVGYTQYALALPAGLVAVHVLLATALWVYTALYIHALRQHVD